MTAVLVILAIFSILCTVLGVYASNVPLQLIQAAVQGILDGGAFDAAKAQAEANRQAAIAQNGPKG